MAAVCMLPQRMHALQCDDCGMGYCLPDEVRTIGIADWSVPEAFDRGRQVLRESVLWWCSPEVDLCLGCRSRRN